MLDPIAASRAQRRPSLAICAYDGPASEFTEAEAGAPVNLIWLRADVSDGDEAALAARLESVLTEGSAQALLLVGRDPSSEVFRLQLRAENRRAEGGRIDETGPSSARVTAAAAELVQSLKDVGLDAGASSEGAPDRGGYLLYRVLTALPEDRDVPLVALLRTPATASERAVADAVRVCALTMARRLSPLARAG